MLIIDRLLVGGIKFVLGKVASAVEQELNDDTVLREQLLAAQMKLELGELTQAEFDELERDVLVRLREIQERKQGGAKGPIAFQRGEGEEAEELRIVGADATFGGDEGE